MNSVLPLATMPANDSIVPMEVAALETPRKRGTLSPERLARVLKLIDNDLGLPLTTQQLAAEVHLSEFHFCRMFRQSTGHSPHEFLTLKRMERARELLATTQRSLREIAEAVGYKTHAHFTSVFHTHVGVTPATFRRAGHQDPQPAAG